jgi:hypothetical protein
MGMQPRVGWSGFRRVSSSAGAAATVHQCLNGGEYQQGEGDQKARGLSESLGFQYVVELASPQCATDTSIAPMREIAAL